MYQISVMHIDTGDKYSSDCLSAYGVNQYISTLLTDIQLKVGDKYNFDIKIERIN